MQGSILLALNVVILLAGCGGVSRKTHFEQPKTYGRPIVPGIDPDVGAEEEEVVQEEIAGPESKPADPSVVRPVAEPVARPAETPTAPITVEPIPAPQPDPVVVTEPEIEPETNPDPVPQPTVIDPEMVVSSTGYRGMLVPQSIRFITTEGDFFNPWDYSLGRKALSYLEGKSADMKIYSMQTYGDEATGVSTLKQHAISNSADFGVMFGEESESGSQIVDRVVGDARCPAAMVCTRRILWQPTTGQERTFCYRDRDSLEATVIPLAPAPNFPEADLVKVAGSYGPYRVDKFLGKVDCTRPDYTNYESSQDIVIHVGTASRPEITHQIQTSGMVPADLVVRVLVEKASPDYRQNAQPYVDQTTRMASRTEFYINFEEKNIVKIVKFIRKNLMFAGDDSWIGELIRWINWISPIEGLFAEVHVEYCKNYLRTDVDSRCSEGGE